MEVAHLVTPAAILISGVLAWLYHRRISARRATLDFVARTEVENPDWREIRALFGNLASGDGQGLLDLVNPSTDEQIEQSAKIAIYLGHCEFVAVAIQQHAMDEKTYKQWQHTAYVKNMGTCPCLHCRETR